MKPCHTQSRDQTGLIVSALTFAAQKHSGQLRKGRAHEPYINHLISVADILWNTGNIRDTDTITAGILHDTVEDTATTLEEISMLFGTRTASIVREVTDDKTLTKTERRHWQVEHASLLSFEARLVKIADKISNIDDIIGNPPVGWSEDDRIEYVRWSKDVVDQMRGTNSELEKMFDHSYHEAMHILLS
jgi:GTP diphosphokinase / guanosine-3',5'-bis(diphosphate) 3'-diphosphatase